MKPAKLNHIGIAVANLPELKKLFARLGLDVAHEELVSDQGVRTHFLPLPSAPANLELLEPVDAEGTVNRFIQKRGPGIHHLAFEVEDLDDLSKRLRSDGYRLIYDSAKPGAHGMRMNFIHPASAGGILVEIMEIGEAGVKSK